MGSGALQILFFLVLPWFFGMALLRALGICALSDRLAYWAWSWVLGGLGSALVLGLWLATSPASMGPGYPLSIMVGIGALCYRLGRRRRAPVLEPLPEAQRLRGPLWERCCFRAALIFVLCFALERLLTGYLLGVFGNAVESSLALRAKLIFHAMGFNPAYAAALQTTELSDNQEPLLNPLLQVWGFMGAGHSSAAAGKLIILAFHPALLLLLASSLRCVLRPAVAGLVLLLFTTMAPLDQSARLANGTVFLGLGALMMLDGYLRWKRDGAAAWLCLAAWGLALAVAGDRHGILLVLAWPVALSLTWLGYRRERPTLLRFKTCLWMALPTLLVAALHALHQARYQPGGPAALGLDLAALSGLFLPWPAGQLPGFDEYVQAFFLGGRQCAYLLGAFWIMAICLLPRRGSARLGYGACLVGSAILLLMLVPVASPEDLEAPWRAASGRLLLLALPAAALWIAAAAGEHLGLCPSTHDPRAAAKALGRWRPLRSMLLAYLICMALANSASALRHLVRNAGATLKSASQWSAEQRLNHSLGQADAELGLAPGTHHAVYAALQGELPEQEPLWIQGSTPESLHMARELRTLSHPRQVHVCNLDLSMLETLAGKVWVLELGPQGLLQEGLARRVAGGTGWTLWH